MGSAENYYFDDDDNDNDNDDDDNDNDDDYMDDDDTPLVSNDMVEEYDLEEEEGSKNKGSVMFRDAAGKLMLNHVVHEDEDGDESTPDTHINHQSTNTTTPAAASSISSQENQETNKNHDDEDDDEQFSTTFVCSQCWKDFKSPKALAGHMRIHASPPPIHYNDDDDEEEDKEEKLRAAALDLFAFYEKIHNFDSACNSSSTTKVAADADQTNILKPDRTSVVYRSSNSHDASQPVVSNCINILSPNFSGTTSNYNNSKHGDGLDTTINTDKRGYRGGAKAVVIASNKRRRENCPRDDDQPDSRNLGTIHKKEKNMKLMSDGSKEEEDDERRKKKKRSYECDICNKEFPSHQALGGHRSSHNKFKVSIIDTSRTTSTTYNTANLVNKDQEVEGVVELHQCKICKKSFSTGQALGGHKRCHWTPPNPPLLATTNSSSSADCSSQVITGNRVLDFDLNEMPPDDDD